MGNLFIKSAVSIAALGLVAFRTGSARTAADDLFARIYERGVIRQQTLRSIRARFTETTVSSLLIKPLVAHGTIVAQRPARVVMTYADPVVKTLTIDGASLVVQWPGRGEREQIDIADVQKQIDRYFTHASLDGLRRLFQISARPDPAVSHADLIEMRPRRKQMQQALDRLDLWIDRERTLLVQMRMTFPGGDQKTIKLDDMEVDVPAG